MEANRFTSPKFVLTFAGIIAVIILFFSAIGNMVEELDAKEVMVIQSPWSGSLTWYLNPGPEYQGWGSVTKYERRSKYLVDNYEIQFSDGAKAKIMGSGSWDMPLSEQNLNELHKKFRSTDAIATDLVQTVVDKVLYVTGQLMTSRESYGERKNDLIFYVQDQLDNGIYRTNRREVETKDELTGEIKRSTISEILIDANGKAQRAEGPVLGQFGIKTFNFSISKVTYSPQVQAQIENQQKITMEVQTSIADAKKAEQAAITVAKQGEANAAEAKWAQEVLKAKAVTAAQQELEVATLQTKQAEQYKQKRILEADADAEYKRRIIVADGALSQKLEAYIKVNEAYADAMSKMNVPSTIMGGSGSNAATTTQDLMSLLTAKTARDLALDVTPNGK